MEVSDQLRCLFSATVEEQEGSYMVEVPKREVQRSELQADDTYRVAILSTPSTDSTDESEDNTRLENNEPEPPVEEGEMRTVEIEDLGDQGDGITRVERGFVVIVPETEMGERVTVEISDVKENVAFGEVIERLNYYG